MKNFKRFDGTKTQKVLEAIVDLHDEMRNCYFWNPPTRASDRRSYEERRSNFLEFSINSTEYEVSQKTSCSCKNIYYTLIVMVNGEKKDVRAIRKLVA